MKRFFISTVVISLFAVPQFTSAANLGFGEFFSDVQEPHPYTYQIDWLADNGVLRGYDTGKFQPEKCVNRAEFLKMLYATLERDLDDLGAGAGWASYFSDVDTEAWYWKYLRYALQTGSVQGYPDKTFRPDQCVKRVEAVKIATLEFHDGKVPPPRGALQETLVDVAEDAWYSPMMEYAHDANVLGLSHVKNVGGGNVRYFPDQDMTRGEVAYLLYMMKALKDNGLAAHDSALWSGDRSNILFNDERGILLPKMLSDVYAFDGCGKVADAYPKESWYAEWKVVVTAAGIDVTKIVDACYSMEAKRLIFLVQGGYLELTPIYKYSVDTGMLEKAIFTGNPSYAIASIPEFGKRQGNFISLIGEAGDAGAGTQYAFEYYFGKNVLELRRTREISFDERVGGTPTKPIYYGSGKAIYGPWKNY